MCAFIEFIAKTCQNTSIYIVQPTVPKQLSWQHLQNAFCFTGSFISRHFALPDLRLLVVTITLPATNREFSLLKMDGWFR